MEPWYTLVGQDKFVRAGNESVLRFDDGQRQDQA